MGPTFGTVCVWTQYLFNNTPLRSQKQQEPDGLSIQKPQSQSQSQIFKFDFSHCSIKFGIIPTGEELQIYVVNPTQPSWGMGTGDATALKILFETFILKIMRQIRAKLANQSSSRWPRRYTARPSWRERL